MYTAGPASSTSDTPTAPEAEAEVAAGAVTGAEPGAESAGHPTGARPRTPRPAALATSLRRALPALTVFAVARLAGLTVVVLWAHHRGRHPRDLLGLRWDALWYHRIAEWGYGTFIPSWYGPGLRYSDLAFFPLYPMTVRALDTVLPVGSVATALLVAWVSAGLAAWGVFAVVDHCYGRRTATALVLIWGLLPHAVVLSMAYTEPMMCALATWALYAVLTGRWLTAGVLSALAGLTRPNGIAVAAAVAVAVAADAWQRWRTGRPQQPRAWLAALLAPLGWCGYVAWVGAQSGGGAGGILHGYFDVQHRWGSDYDFGRYTLRYAEHLVRYPDSLGAYLTLALCATALVLLYLALLNRMPLPLLVYSAVLVAIALGGANFFYCKPRFLLPAFPLLLPLAGALAKARPRAAALAVLTLAGFSLGYGAYVLTMVRAPL